MIQHHHILRCHCQARGVLSCLKAATLYREARHEISAQALEEGREVCLPVSSKAKTGLGQWVLLLGNLLRNEGKVNSVQ